jgi:LAO/AO transport system kinase
MSPLSALWELNQHMTPHAHRIGISGPPGAGKSSVISVWARRRLDRGRRVGILAVDPTSPVSGGSLLGDRIRMDDVASHPALYLRSLPSRFVHDGLCPNAASMLRLFDQYRFDDVVLEAVGGGQVDYGARALVDTLVLILGPLSGDVVQAMKAGILELADIIVVNKSDLPATEHTVRELLGVMALRPAQQSKVQVLKLSASAGSGFEEFDRVLDARAQMLKGVPERRKSATGYALQNAVRSIMDETMAHYEGEFWQLPIERQLKRVFDDLQARFADRATGAPQSPQTTSGSSDPPAPTAT